VSDASSCLFCRVASGAIPATVVYQDEVVTAFRDINPQAPLHVLVIPNQHLVSTNDLREQHDALVGKLVRTAAEVARAEGVAASGYRLVSNCGAQAGQSVAHLHLHLLGGRALSWPPG
jgi:histidine triad (HIT) family protein